MQKIVIAVVALALLVPIGALGLSSALTADPGQDPAASSGATAAPAVDPASQPSASPTALPPAPQAGQDAHGAQATASYLLQTYAYMMATGDTAPWEARIDPGCQVCVQFVANAKKLHSEGGYSVGGEFTIAKVGFQGAGTPPATGTATVDFSQSTQQVITDPRQAGQTVPALTGRIQMKLAWDGKAWRVGDMSVVDAHGASDGGS